MVCNTIYPLNAVALWGSDNEARSLVQSSEIGERTIPLLPTTSIGQPYCKYTSPISGPFGEVERTGGESRGVAQRREKENHIIVSIAVATILCRRTYWEYSSFVHL